MTATEELLGRNAQRAPRADSGLPAEPALKVTIVTCMDCRIDLAEALGLRPGEAHVLRNAGGVVTDDVIRSLAISQRKLGTREVMLVHHTRCGMLTFTTREFGDELERETGFRPAWSAGAFPDVEQDVRDSIEHVLSSPFLGLTSGVRGFVHDVDTGAVTEVR